MFNIIYLGRIIIFCRIITLEMIKLFIERNLNKTINFLNKLDLLEPCSLMLDAKDLNAISLQNSGKFYNAYTSLLCPDSAQNLNNVVFCACCCSKKNFLRNYSLVLDAPNTLSIIKCQGYKNDPFLKFIEAKVERSKSIILEVIADLPLFWDAYLLLCDLTDEFVPLDLNCCSQIAPYFYLQLKIIKDIDPISIPLSSFVKANSFNISSLPYNTETLDLNSKAALNYCYGNQVQALKLFKSIDFCKNFDISFFELFGMLMYNTNDSLLQTLCENLNNFFKFLPETYVLLGLFRLSTNNYNDSVNLFKKSLKKRESSDVHCLLAYSYIKLNEYSSAMLEYQEALKISPCNFRIFYSVAQGYFSMNKIETSLWYCKKALDIRGDGSIYKLLGRIYLMLNSLEVALEYFETSLLHDEVDSLLYMADAYRKKNEISKALVFYERYVSLGQKNVKVVIKYLVDYYEEHGNEEKSKYFRSILKNTCKN